MGFIRIILFTVLVYFIYKFLKSLLKPGGKKRPPVRGKPENHIPPPYDPNQVEDINYEEVKRKKRGNPEPE